MTSCFVVPLWLTVLAKLGTILMDIRIDLLRFTMNLSLKVIGMLQFAGVWMALATFLGIWWGHVGVRWLEAHSPDIRPPAFVLVLLGLGLNGYALATANLTLAGVSSIIGITLLWDAFELYRQVKRVKKGHAPANPDNPRHAAYLAAAGLATTEDLLGREPIGRPQVAAVSKPDRRRERTISSAGTD